MLLLSRLQRGPNRLPYSVFVERIRGVRNRLSRLIRQGELRNLIPALAIFLIPKAGMIRIELHDCVSIRCGLIRVDRDHAHVDVVRNPLFYLVRCHDGCSFKSAYKSAHSKTKPATDPSLEGPMAGYWKLVREC